MPSCGKSDVQATFIRNPPSFLELVAQAVPKYAWDTNF